MRYEIAMIICIIMSRSLTVLRSQAQSERETVGVDRWSRPLRVFGVVLAIAAGCSTDSADPTASTSTSADTITSATIATTTPDPAPTTTAAPIRTEPVDRRLLVIYESRSAGEVTESLEFEYAGVVRPGAGGWRFDGMSAVRSGDRSLVLGPFVASRPTSGDASDDLFSTGYDPEIPRPAMSEDGTLDTPDTSLFLDDVGYLGYTSTLTWEVIHESGSTVRLRGHSDIDSAFSTRGAPQIVSGTIEAELELDLEDPFRINGWYAFDGVHTLGSEPPRTVAQRQEYRTEDVDFPALDEWTVGVGPPSRTTEPAPESPGTEFTTYGGGSWSGSLRVTDEWSAVTLLREPGLLSMELDVDSSFTPIGQWIEVLVTGWEAEHPLIEQGEQERGNVRLAVSIDSYGDITPWYRTGTSEFDARTFHIFLGHVLSRLLPPLPPRVLTPGDTWTTPGEDGVLYGARTFELIEVAGGVAEFTVDGEVSVYHGDRYSGESYAGMLDGRIFVDLATGIPIDVDLLTTGTATSSVAGVPDPGTSAPWQQTLSATAG